MYSDYLLNTRFKLQKRLNRVITAKPDYFHFTLLQIWGYFQDDEVIKAILDNLEARTPECEDEANRVLSGQRRVGLSESENNGICYWVIKKCAASDNYNIENELSYRLNHFETFVENIEWFRTLYVEPLFDYIEENIDDKRLVLLMLKRYKHHCEWFNRSQLYSLYSNDSRNGEKLLSRSLYEYLHAQGISFQIEPQSASGEVDFISDQTGSDRLIADVKLFNPDSNHNKSYIVRAFRQVYDYTKDFNEAFGYVVIFKLCSQDLSIHTDHQEATIPFITHNNKSIFFVIIDIFEYKETASKRGKLNAVEIIAEDFITVLNEPQQ